MANEQLTTGGLLLPNIQLPNIAGALERRGVKERNQLIQQRQDETFEMTKALKKFEFSRKLLKGIVDQPSQDRAISTYLSVFPGEESDVEQFIGRTFDPKRIEQVKRETEELNNKLIKFKEEEGIFDPVTQEVIRQPGEAKPKELALTETRLSAIATGAITDPNVTPEEAKRIQADITAGRTARRGAGITTTLPDGTVIQIGGPVTKAPGFGVAATNVVQKDLLAATQGLQRLTQIENSIDDKFLTIPGKFKAATLNLKDKLGNFLGLKTLTQDEQAFLSDFSTFAQDSIENINLYIKEITGAQMSEKEANRLRKAVADIGDGLFAGDGPIKFRSKLTNQLRKFRLSVARLNWINTQGIRSNFGPRMQGVENRLPLQRMPAIMAKRESEIMTRFKKELPGRNQQEYDQLALSRLSEEFGLIGNQ
ncbi:hypothetical protein LCGC14_1571720 [marine sediment metagenome]|uniref:Uncharacterized protein n=1 Tax=marine sediment metagenome TaxID=412755 RepID=A0A0F9IJL9_9ZZZZ